eukprot:s1607_g10.t1
MDFHFPLVWASILGRGATKIRQNVEKTYQGQVPVLSEYQGTVYIPAVTHYKHFGGHLTRNGNVLPEVQVCMARTMAKLKPLRKILACQDLQIERRRSLVRSIGLTVLTVHTGSWWKLTQAEMSAWHAAVFRVYVSIHERDSDGQVSHRDYYELAEAMQSPMPIELLYLQRLNLLFHILKVGDDNMIAAILHNADQANDFQQPLTSCSSEKVERAHLLRVQSYRALKEWGGDKPDSDDDKNADEHASSSFQARERRLSAGQEILKDQERILGDTQVEVVNQKEEWRGGAESDEEQAEQAEQRERTVKRRASESFEKRESRLQQGALVQLRSSFSEASVMSFDQTGRAAEPPREDRCSDRCTNMCVLS